jgi:hypothetical protein
MPSNKADVNRGHMEHTRETVTHPCRHMQFDFVYMISVTLERDISQLDPKKQKNGEKEQTNKQTNKELLQSTNADQNQNSQKT